MPTAAVPRQYTSLFIVDGVMHACSAVAAMAKVLAGRTGLRLAAEYWQSWTCQQRKHYWVM